MSDLVLVTTARSTRLHRATCKRVPAKGSPAVQHAAPRLVLAARPASCCKPQVPDTLADEAAAAQRAGAESLSIYRQAVPAQPAAEQPVPAAEQQADGPTATVTFSNRGISLSVWRALGVQGAQAVAQQYDVQVASADKTTHSVQLQGAQAQQAAAAVASLWESVWSAWAEHRDGGAETGYADALAISRTAARRYRRTWIAQQIEAQMEADFQ